MIGPSARWERFAARRRARAAGVAEHEPDERYNCQKCEYTPWPCSEARTRLLKSFGGDRMALMTYLGVHLTRALQALPDTHPALIVGQIVHWVPRRRH
ncbi:hypothetical protein GCM10022225_36040 [Plantactinospora mayteni]|uniref:Flavin reductase n=1 Tax=Plantactinospora mayteni TaxID=566021 RepID=A0ABQ4EM11_9ACTN|nr:hypothetical protein Pma05_23580 [Plantactinospora mayteni]